MIDTRRYRCRVRFGLGNAAFLGNQIHAQHERSKQQTRTPQRLFCSFDGLCHREPIERLCCVARGSSPVPVGSAAYTRIESRLTGLCLLILINRRRCVRQTTTTNKTSTPASNTMISGVMLTRIDYSLDAS